VGKCIYLGPPPEYRVRGSSVSFSDGHLALIVEKPYMQFSYRTRAGDSFRVS